MKDFFEQMTDLYDPGPTLLSKYWQFMRLSLSLSLSLSMCVRVCVCARPYISKSSQL